MSVQTIADKSAISLSIICAVHCLMFPLIVTLLPSYFWLNGERFHLFLLFAVVPLSIGTLLFSCLKHKKHHLLAMGLSGILILVFALISEDILGPNAEKILTLIGASIVSLGHFFNLRQCRPSQNCSSSQYEA